MSEETANPADVAEQQQDVVAEPVDEEHAVGGDEVPVLPEDANEADVLEQSLETGDDEDEGERG